MPDVPDLIVNEDEENAMFAFFRYFDYESGDGNYQLTLQEMLDGVAAFAE